jgi:putative membrane protein
MQKSYSFALLGATALVAVALAGAPLVAQTTYPAPQAQLVTYAHPMTATGYVQNAQSVDLFEFEASKIGAQRAQNEQVRLFAQKLIDGHSASVSKMTLAAQQAGVMPTYPTLTAQQNTKLDNLRKASISGFDKVYISTQLEAQEDALRIHRGYSSGGDQAIMRTTSNDMATVTEGHIAAARKISSLLASEG